MNLFRLKVFRKSRNFSTSLLMFFSRLTYTTVWKHTCHI